jgi:serine/threonine protein kinase
LIVTYDERGKKIFTFTAFISHPFHIDPEYELDAIKGWGTYGLVASGRNTITNQQVAIKRVSNVFDKLGDTKRILREIKILSRHPITQNF